MEIFELVMVVATLLCSLTAGFVFAFAVVVMPGLRRLDDRAFIRAFQVIDGVIQNGQPLFGLVWIGSVVAISISAVLAFGQLDRAGSSLVIFGAAIYLLGVQLPTFSINVPLNNKLQRLDVDVANEAALSTDREDFEPRWVRWNSIRTACACLASALLMASLVAL